MRDKSGRFTKAPKRTLESDLADTYWAVQELRKDLRALRSEAGEHWRQIEGDIEKMQKVIGVLSKRTSDPFKDILPVGADWTCRWALVGHAGDPCPKCGAGPCPVIEKAREASKDPGIGAFLTGLRAV